MTVQYIVEILGIKCDKGNYGKLKMTHMIWYGLRPLINIYEFHIDILIMRNWQMNFVSVVMFFLEEFLLCHFHIFFKLIIIIIWNKTKLKVLDSGFGSAKN